MPFKQFLHSPHAQVWLPRIVSLLLVVLIAQSLAKVTERYLLTANSQAVDSTVIGANDSAQKPNLAFQYAGLIAQASLFGVAGQTANTPIVAPDTQLNLKLMGILATGGIKGIAIIFGDNEEKFYKVGDRVPGNATLKEVHPDRVILESSRGFETLRLPVERDPNFMPANVSAYTRPAAAESSDIQQQLTAYRNQFTENPSSLLGLANIQEARTSDGAFQGFYMYLRDEALAAQIGLQANDIIVGVNDIKISQPSDGVQVLRKLRNAKGLDITVLRNGQEIRITHEID